ncbi:class I SAM-dependent methyltransferase [Aspergillus stella-maris]|uniref:class I SAM-dependent methyltransferase n=1 Tax=Aspergillus stella-maris TaxID=1810926 RepID=UPI003CCCDAB2
MGDASGTEIYCLARDEAESRRLNGQHDFIVKAVMGLINSAIPLDGVSTVADVGTGTGIWLLEARKLLNEKFPGAESNRYFHGFDISDAQFAPSHPQNVEFSVQDVLKPFPSEHHNRYDLVNVRMLVAALPEAEFRLAVQNLTTILRPGGYIQWVELDTSGLVDAPESKDTRTNFLVKSWLDYIDMNNLLLCPANILEDSYKKNGLQDISNTTYTLENREEELKAQAQIWETHALSSIIPLMLQRQGFSAEAAQDKVDEGVRGLHEWFGEGKMVRFGFGSVIGRKA